MHNILPGNHFVGVDFLNTFKFVKDIFCKFTRKTIKEVYISMKYKLLFVCFSIYHAKFYFNKSTNPYFPCYFHPYEPVNLFKNMALTICLPEDNMSKW